MHRFFKIFYIFIGLSSLNILPAIGNNLAVLSYQAIEEKLTEKFKDQLEGVLIAIGIDGSLVRINDQYKAEMIDPYASEFMAKCLQKGARILLLTGRHFEDKNLYRTLEDIKNIDQGKTLSILKKSWEDIAQKSGENIDDYQLSYEYACPEAQQKKMNSALFIFGILFTRGQGEIPYKGECLIKFFQLTKLSGIHSIILIDDQEGYLDDFREAFYNNPESFMNILNFQCCSFRHILHSRALKY